MPNEPFLSGAETLALVASGISLLLSGLSVWYTRKMAKNDSERMKRKKPIIEIDRTRTTSPSVPGFVDIDLTVRNLEPFGIYVKSITVKRRNAMLITYATAYDDPHSPYTPKVLKSPLPTNASVAVNLKIEPFGTAASPPHSHGDTLRFRFCAQGADQLAHFEVAWAWADGAKD